VIAPGKNTELGKEQYLVLIPLGIALNLGIAAVVNALKLPVYLDAVGTIIITLILGLKAGMLTGVLSFLLGGILVNPVLPYFVLTQAAISVYVYYAARNGFLKTTLRTVGAGIGLGVVAGLVSAPVIAIVFGGITGSGRSLITGFFLASGRELFESVILSGFASEPFDKTLQCLLAVWLIRGVPESLLRRFGNPMLRKNEFLSPTTTSSSSK